MPLRRDGDNIEDIDNFDDWIEKTLREAIARGEFDNLPRAGKPITIERNPFQPELDMAFSRMKNAGMAPAWIELDREIRRMHEALDRWLEAAAGRLAAEARRIEQGVEAPQSTRIETRPWHRRWWPFRLFIADEGELDVVDPAVEWRRWRYERCIVREQYMERADQLDAKIVLFNNSIPRPLWHLEKARFRTEKATARLDRAVPLDHA